MFGVAPPMSTRARLLRAWVLLVGCFAVVVGALRPPPVVLPHASIVATSAAIARSLEDDASSDARVEAFASVARMPDGPALRPDRRTPSVIARGVEARARAHAHERTSGDPAYAVPFAARIEVPLAGAHLSARLSFAERRPPPLTCASRSARGPPHA